MGLNIIGRLMGGFTGIAQAGMGGAQKRQGFDMAEKLKRPKFSTSSGQRRLQIESKYMNRNSPTHDIDLSLANRGFANEAKSAGRLTTNIGDYLNALDHSAGKLYGDTTNVGIDSAKSRYKGVKGTGRALSDMQATEELKYKHLFDLYKMDAAAASALINAGYENTFEGSYGIADSIYSLGSSGGGGGGGSAGVGGKAGLGQPGSAGVGGGG